jgi:pilus assembly protein CpaC
MRKLLVLAIAALGFIAMVSSDAAELVSPPGGGSVQPAAAPGAGKRAGPSDSALAAMRQIPPSGQPILLEVGKGTLIRLPRPASTVFIANPDIADVQVKSPALIYLSAKAPGETVVYAVDADDNVLLHAPVRVDHDLSKLRESMHALMPGEQVTVSSVDGSLILGGNVSTANRAEKARALAAALTGNNKDQPIVNQMAVATPNQVNIRVKIAEVNRTVLKSLGFNWTAAVNQAGS